MATFLMGARRARRKEPWARFAIKAALAGVIAASVSVYLTGRFGLLVDAQVERSLPGVRVLLIDRERTEVVRGGIYAFPSQGLEPWIKDGQLVVKIADGVPGDRIEISEAGVRVNGSEVVSGLILAKTLHRDVGTFVRTETVQPGQAFMLGRAINSFDSRYWGPIEQSRIVGNVHILF